MSTGDTRASLRKIIESNVEDCIADPVSRDGFTEADEMARLIVESPWLAEHVAAVVAAREAKLKRLTRWKEEALPVLSGLQEVGRALGVPMGRQITARATLDTALDLKNDRDEARAVLGAVAALTTYRVDVDGELLCTQCEDYVEDCDRDRDDRDCDMAKIRAVLAPVSGAVEEVVRGDMDTAVEAGAAAIYRLTYPGSDWVVQTEPMRRSFLAAAREALAAGVPHLAATPVAKHEQEVRAAAWDEGARAAGGYGHEDSWTHDMNPLNDNPHRAARADAQTEGQR